ncbi:MAG: glucoamylase family protein [Polyangiaceae bacterium]
MLTSGGQAPGAIHLCMGWHPESGFINARWSDFNEAKFLYIQAYGLSDITNAGWDKISRPAVNYKGLDLITGGPLFMHEMSEGFYDFRGRRDRLGYDYSIEERNAALANREYCIDNPKKMKGYGPDFWGLNACDGPDGYGGFGAPGWISDDGTVCPTAPLAAMPAIPKEASSFAAALKRDYPAAWGKYGFPDALNPTRNWIDTDVLGIDLGMMLCAVENSRSGLIWRINSANPIVRKGFDRAGLAKAAPDARLRVKSGG